MVTIYDNTQRLYLPLQVDPTPLTALSQYRLVYEAVTVAINIGIFRCLSSAKTADALAEELDIDGRIAFYLLKVLVHFGCLQEHEDEFVNAPLAETFLLDGNYLYLGHEFICQLPEDSFGSQLYQRLRKYSNGRTPEPKWNQERLRQIGVFGLTGSIQNTLGACNLEDARHLLDLGGGHGFYSIALAQKYPELKVTLFDLPHIITLAKDFIQQFAVDSQVNLMGGDFLTDDIGFGYDAILCANILHSQKRDILLPKVRQALKPGGKIILKCRVADAPDNLENAVTNLRWQVLGGRELYDFNEWQAFLTSHGFLDVTQVGLAGIYATIIAHS